MTDKPLSNNFKSFISESEIKEKRRIRQEEWDKVRQPGQSIEVPEEIVDNRTLFERLKQEKDKKQEEYEESHKLKNQIRGLDNDEADFLSYVSERQTEILEERYQEEKEMLDDFKKANEKKPATENSNISVFNEISKPLLKTTIKSQSELLSGAIKRKRSDDKDVDIPKSKIVKDSIFELRGTTTEIQQSNQASTNNQDIDDKTSIPITNSDQTSPDKYKMADRNNPLIRNVDIEAKVIGYLPGIGDYTSDDDSDDAEDSSSCSSDIEIKTVFPPIIRIKDVQKAMNQGNH